MVLVSEDKLPENRSQVMASAKSQQLPNWSLSGLKRGRSNPGDASHGDSESKKRSNLGIDNVQNGMSCSASNEKRTKLKILIRHSEKKSAVASEQGMGGEGQDREESGQRTWNLRPRPAARKNFNAVGGPSGMSTPSRNTAETSEKKEKPNKFSLNLTREEIEEDFLAMTGAKPPRKPKKRPKNVQNAIYNLTPGLWLHEVNHCSYDCKVPKTSN